ncbi:FadR family transcriptional regulator [Achromobacter denitrificans]|uniref:FadR/GntR family transcriptional regulator n=1 Tax=Achromobacter denitrificans TaxID=32002 RepID=UPI00240D7038|nr:FCD domain-containing protein [Achromobacter denitrificans]MBV2160064.1 FCD domain-containing protein [Achromobacter denitrificans]MDX3877148.1 FCD domain-containing protein [Achromobacter sp.]WFC68637.1 FadR family transcriptional regulator [Achromobacter denitrificans]
MLSKSLTLTEQVARQIAGDIAEGVHSVGAKLPPGRALAEQYGVSAAVIREATERLRAQGLIQSRQGSGSVVVSRTGAQGFQVSAGLDDREQLASVYELRMELEGGAAALAARRRNATDLVAMAEALAALEANLEHPEQGVEHDIAFHVAIAAATHNRYYQDLLQYLNLQLRLAVSTARTNSRRQEGLTAVVHQEHVAVYDAILAGDPDRARLAATRHLQQAASRLRLDLLSPAARQTS